MYTQANLITDIRNYTPYNKEEEGHAQSALTFLNNDTNPFDRKNFSGHVTGSAWLISPDHQMVLLTHHTILNKWLQFGGHADGEADIKNVAKREAQEESGIQEISELGNIFNPIFDIDVHLIPENIKKQEPDHLHYDIRYIFKTSSMDFSISSESKELKWVDINDIFKMNLSPSMMRMARKWQNII